MKTKKFWQSKTIWFAVLTAIVGILTAIGTQYPDMGWTITLVGFINVFLRLNTDKGIE